eukprot:3693874-Prymnesium_polylepis.1
MSPSNQPLLRNGICRSGTAMSAYQSCVRPNTRRAALAVAAARFRPGNWWVWLYRDPSGTPSSWERYSVRTSEEDEVVIDMATRFDAEEPYNTHHRMRVSLGESLTAADNQLQWSLRNFAFCQEGVWRDAPHRDNVQAFEEKFDGFLMWPVRPLPVSISAERTKDVASVGAARLVQTRRHTYTNAWYVLEPREHRGVAAFKAFGREGEDAFTFELVAFGRAESTDDMGSSSMMTDGRSAFG